MTQEHRLITALKQVKHELLIPAAEYVPAIPACWEIIDAALAASTPVGGWEEPVAWRYRYPNDEAWQLTQDHDQAFKNTGEVEPLGVIPFALAPPPPSVSIDNGSRPQEAVPTKQAEPAVVGDDGWITHDGGPNPVPGARVVWRNREGSSEDCNADELSGWEHPYGPDGCWDVVAYQIVQQTADGWTEWSGGQNPVPGRRVEVRFEVGGYADKVSDDLRWIYDRGGYDIIAYRLVPQPADGCSSNEGVGA